jgi:hypothetical protein
VRELFRVADELSPSIVFIGARLRPAGRRWQSAAAGPTLLLAGWLAGCERAAPPQPPQPPQRCRAAPPSSSSTPARADEIDAIGTKRYDAHSGGEREIQRTMLELLNQLDGFDSLSEVKVGAWRAPCTSLLVAAQRLGLIA